MREIARAKAEPFFEEEWQILPWDEAAKVMEACSSPVRQAVLWLLERHGTVRQSELARAVNTILAKSLGERYRRYNKASLIHHLKKLESAELIGFERGDGREKYIFQKAAARLQIRKIKPVTLKVQPETLEEIAGALKTMFGGK